MQILAAVLFRSLCFSAWSHTVISSVPLYLSSSWWGEVKPRLWSRVCVCVWICVYEWEKQQQPNTKDSSSSNQIPSREISLENAISIWPGALRLPPFCGGSTLCVHLKVWTGNNEFLTGAVICFILLEINHSVKIRSFSFEMELVVTPSRNEKLMCWCCQL